MAEVKPKVNAHSMYILSENSEANEKEEKNNLPHRGPNSHFVKKGNVLK